MAAAEPIRIRARARNGVVEATLLMPHPMETGMRTDATGGLVAAHYITDLHIAVAGRTVMSAKLGIAVSQDPLLQFRFRGAAVGDTISVTWTDSRGDRRSDEALIA